MSGISVRSAFGKLQKLISKDLRDEFFVTGQPMGSARRALDTLSIGNYLLADDIIESGSDDNLVILTGHNARKGDFLRINTSANGILEFEVAIDDILDANSFRLAAILSANLEAGDTVSILRPINQRLSDTGATITALDPSPINFRKDGSVTEVSEDTVTPGNTEALPVKIVSASGTNINITAGDIEMALDHTEDSVRIGNGVDLVDVNGSGEMLVHDQETIDGLASIETILSSLEGKDFSTQTTLELCRLLLVAIENKDFATDAGLGSIYDILGSVVTYLSNIDGKDFATQTTLAAILTQVQLQATQVQTQPVSLASLPLPSGASTAANQTTGNTSLAAISLASGAPADAAVTNPALSASIIATQKGILTLLASLGTKLDSLQTSQTPAFSNHETQSVVANTLFTAPASARRMVLQNSLTADGPVRITPSGVTPTSANGFYLGVGQSTSEIPAGSFRAIASDGSNAGNVSVMWFV